VKSLVKLVSGSIALVLAVLPSAAVAEVYDLPPEGNDVVGALTTVIAREDDTLLDIARRHGLGYEDIVRANPDVDTWLPGEGTEVTLPTRYVLPPGPRRGVVLNLAEYRLYYYPTPEADQPAVVMTYPISIGRMDWETPLGRTTIVSKMRNPSWYPPESIRAEHAADGDPLPRIVPPGPQNPLGDYAMRLGLPGYLIHGTNRPDGVGMRVTHGCIRMFPEDIDYLFGRVDVNTSVRIINEPVKVGWTGDELVIEVHKTLEFNLPESEPNAEVMTDADQPVVEPPVIRNALTALTEQFVAATNEQPGMLDWDKAEELLARADGIPAVAGRKIKDAATSAASE
jgi:L,D-transpeptidase ErfK/SrfK